MSNQNSNLKPTAPKLDRLPLSNLVQLHIPDEIRDKIRFLCKRIAKDEWSGVLFYQVEGSIQNTKKLKVILKDILLMDRGSASYTNFDWDEDVVNYRMDNPESIDWIVGHIHSHNTMGVFFSGTDWDELNDNCTQHNFYLSVIVNNYLDITAKIAFTGELEEQPKKKFKCKDETGKDYTLTITASKEEEIKPIMLVYDCEVHMNFDDIKVSQDFANRIDAVEEKKKKAIEDAKQKHKQGPQFPPDGGSRQGEQRRIIYDGFDDSKYKRSSWGEDPELDFFRDKSGPSYSRNKKEHEKTLTEYLNDVKKEEEEDDDFNVTSFSTIEEEFAAFVLRLGNVEISVNDSDIIDVLEDIDASIDRKEFNLNSFENSIVSMYPALHDKFFERHTRYQGDRAFLDTLEEIVALFKEHEEDFKFLSGIVQALQMLGNRFEESINQSV